MQNQTSFTNLRGGIFTEEPDNISARINHLIANDMRHHLNLLRATDNYGLIKTLSGNSRLFNYRDESTITLTQ